MYTDDIIKTIILFIIYYLIVIIQIYVGEMISLKVIMNTVFGKDLVKQNNKLFCAIFKNILTSYLAGYICALICAVVEQKKLILIPMYIFSVVFCFPFAPRNIFSTQLIIFADMVGTFIFSLIIHYLFFF